MNTPDYPLVLAIEDFVPTLLAFAGFYLLGGVRQPQVGRTGAVLILAGGVAKSTWKLIVSAGGPDLPWLEGLLFPMMAAGAAMLLWALHSERMPWWPYAGIVIAAGVAGVALGSVEPVFLLATLGVTAISVTGVVLALRARAVVAAALFVVSVVAVGSLAPLRGSDHHATLLYQWIEQGTNTFAQAAFLLAAWLTVSARRRWEPAP
ncbi:hypothetical protein AB0M47_24230 [Hamadaea sp. NPDC051192]|uniref:hypothetical protein n=1 Tax=Hamadaea sp. NPDC051192 TaxID=3154940 RepID=UPI00342E13DD